MTTKAPARETTTWLPVSLLRFDPQVNRDINDRNVTKICEGFDPDAFGVIEVSERPDGTYVVIDGQHRCKAIIDMGWADQRVECKVHRQLTIAQEAALFSKLNASLNLSPIEKFLKRVVAEDPVAVEVVRIAAKVGFIVDRQPRDGNIAAVVSLEKIYRGTKFSADRMQAKALEKTLLAVSQAWGHTYAAVHGDILLGVGWVVLRYNGALDVEALIPRLAAMPGGPARLLGNARGLREMKGGSSVADCIASIVVDSYNKGRRTNKLADWWAN